jgi:GTP cyclohydrolase III
MNYLSGAFSYIAGADTDASPLNVVPRLVDRIVNSALPHDRRAAVVELATVARESPRRQTEVGELALKVIYAVLEQDKEYDDTLRAVLDLLINLCGCIDRTPDYDAKVQANDAPKEDSVFDSRREKEEDARVLARSAEAAATNIDAFLGIPNAMLLLLELLEHPDLFIKCSTLELLTAMAANSRPTIQAAVLGAPQGVARLADLLGDPNPMVRTNSVLVLSALSEGSPEICKIITFSGVVETLFRSIQSVASSSSVVEGGDEPEALEAAIVAQDALQLVSNLLSESTATQSYMRDSGCIPRLCAVLAHAVGRSEVTSASDIVKTGPAAAIAQHEFRNVVLALNCVRFLVRGGSSESFRNKSACASAGILRIVLQLCFGVGYTSEQPERILLRVNAILTAAFLVRGHEECRSVFVTPISTLGGQSRSRSPQLLTLDVVTSDQSPSVRAASQVLLTDSLIADAALGLPATAFLNALVTGAGESRDNCTGGLGSRAPVSSMISVAAGLKSTVVGWPNEADGAGVFYAACTIGWVALRVRGARERLLGAFVSGSGDTLLARVVRALGYAHRENGPASVRIGLLRLVCSWLYRSPSAISAFLSSALHLPLIVELVTKAGTRGDAAACHAQGLAAYVLAICLECAEEDGGIYSENSGFVSGTDGASIVIPRATLADIIHSRIGVTTFLSRMDELRASSSYSEASQSSSNLISPLGLASGEISGRTGTWKAGDLGHDLWYDGVFTGIMEDVYRRVSARVLKLMAEDGPRSHSLTTYASSNACTDQTLLTAGESPKALLSVGAPNGGPRSVTSPMTESGSQAEVLGSFKDLIRTQDISLKEANLKVRELEAGLREAQAQLDAKNRLGADGSWRSEHEDLVGNNSELIAKIADLETVLRGKTLELSALSDAYTALEADRGNDNVDDGMGGNSASEAELRKVRIEKTAALSYLSAERDKTTQLEGLRSQLELEARKANAGRQAAESEADALRAASNGLAEFGDVLEWRRRAELAEAQNCVQTEALDHAHLEANDLRGRLRSAEAGAVEFSSKAHAATAALETMKQIPRSCRQRESAKFKWLVRPRRQLNERQGKKSRCCVKKSRI